ncbi:MAG: hypothetical protein RMK01_04850 [Thermomicrobium sp.]|nr:hypothetical protein [Thermomicrobium sp.]MDW8059380.1 hypothetical protein [Thermomicrobium sp.]
MGKAPQGRSGSDELAAVGELLSALTQALVQGTPDEIVALARLLEARAASTLSSEVDPARLAALATLRERAALLVQTLFVTTDRFLMRALDLQARGQGYRPGRAGAPHQRLPGDETLASVAGYRNGLSDLRI